MIQSEQVFFDKGKGKGIKTKGVNIVEIYYGADIVAISLILSILIIICYT